jgi:aminocarboxymuconate-semialdehyde decarboxylase
METVKNSYPFKVLDDAQNLNIITEEDKNNIWKDNIIQWLFGEV